MMRIRKPQRGKKPLTQPTILPKVSLRAITVTPELVQTTDGRMRYALPENLPLWIFEKPLTIYVETRAA